MPTIKVTEREYDMIVNARRELTMKGLDTISNETRRAELQDFERFTLGAIVGIGALLLLEELNNGGR